MPAGLRSSPSTFSGSPLLASWRNARLQATPFRPTITGSADLTRRQSASAPGRSNSRSRPVDDANAGTVTRTSPVAFRIAAGQVCSKVCAKLPDVPKHAQNSATKAAHGRMLLCPQPRSFPGRRTQYQIAVVGSSGTAASNRSNSVLRTKTGRAATLGAWFKGTVLQSNVRGTSANAAPSR